MGLDPITTTLAGNAIADKNDGGKNGGLVQALPSLISGASQLGGSLGGAAISGDSAENVAQINNAHNQTVANPYYEPIMQRVMAILDGYLKKHGLAAFMPQPGESAPTSNGPAPGQTPEGRPPAAPQSATQANMGQMDGVKPSAPPPAAKPTAQQDDSYKNASLAALLGARRLGITQDEPAFPTTRQFYDQDQAQKAEELRRLNEYIYGQRNVIGRSYGV